jgi:sugar/nucleoside kinase (ribokinase family)
VAFTLSDPFCVDRHRDEFRDLVERDVDIVFANEIEICSLYQVGSFEEALALVRGHCEIAALTRSELGSVIVAGDDEPILVDAEPVPEVVDTTGAGDQYSAGFLHGFTHGYDLETCGRLASIAAAEVISHLGARPEVSLAELAKEQLDPA